MFECAACLSWRALGEDRRATTPDLEILSGLGSRTCHMRPQCWDSALKDAERCWKQAWQLVESAAEHCVPHLDFASHMHRSVLLSYHVLSYQILQYHFFPNGRFPNHCHVITSATKFWGSCINFIQLHDVARIINSSSMIISDVWRLEGSALNYTI